MDGQQAHAKMLNLVNHQENADQNHTEISHLSKLLLTKNTILGKDTEK